MTKKDVPVGATWIYKDEDVGKVYRIWLRERGKTDVWNWSVSWLDGSGYHADWNVSYRSCRNELNELYGLYNVRFKRRKEWKTSMYW